MKNTIRLAFMMILLLATQLFIAQTANSETNKYDFVVAKDGSGDFKTIQEVINAVPFLKTTETKIFIKNGTYKEKLEIPENKNTITFVGETKENVILTYDDFASKKIIPERILELQVLLVLLLLEMILKLKILLSKMLLVQWVRQLLLE